MSDFSLTTLFVVPVGQNALPSSGSTQDLTPGQVGFFKSDYSLATAANIATKPYFYVAQGRDNTYLQGSKRSDKISSTGKNVTEVYKVVGSGTAVNQVTDVSGFNVTCGETVTLTLRAHSSYIETLYFNGLTRSVTVQAPCCDCGADPCDTVDVPALIDAMILKLESVAPGINPDNISLSKFYQFQRIGNDANAILRISGKPLTTYGNPCDVSAFPYEYDRMWFRTFVYTGPATTADFIVADNCNIVANAVITQRSSYPKGTAAEIKQLEIDFHSYQAGYLKSLYRMAGYNQNFESQVVDGTIYDTYLIKFTDIDAAKQTFGDYIADDSTIVIAVPQQNTVLLGLIDGLFNAAFSSFESFATSKTTTSTTTTIWATTSTTSTLIP